jgi:cell division protein FtsX
MTITTLFILVLIIAVILLGIIVFIWFQFNNTSSRLYRIIENRIRLSRVSSEEGIIEEEEPVND